ncbi:unnamed protein product [Mytilus coruscus]|uniref:C1q domain-containing protein n=1 Tax=Mytilus coruscus TaxID=42192 RepID=A0A6J8BUS1_MYTCO|nr:unnamed protein product [Mytilus coruscus]
MEVVAIGIFYVIFYLGFCTSFLLEENTKNPTNDLTEKHYMHVLEMILEEKKFRQNLEISVTQMHTEFKTQIRNLMLDNKTEHVIENKTDFLLQKINDIENKYSSIGQKVVSLQRQLGQVSSDLAKCRNDSYVFRNELAMLKQLKSIIHFQDLNKLNTSVESIKQQLHIYDNNINSLNSKQAARAQDFVALLNQTINLQKTVTEQTEYVGFSACAPGPLSKTGLILFSYVKLSYGINDLSSLNTSGEFRCEKSGFYLIIPAIMSTQDNAEYRIQKNGIDVIPVQVTPIKAEAKIHIGTGSMIVSLNINDTIAIREYQNKPVYGSYSCLTVIKIK